MRTVYRQRFVVGYAISLNPAPLLPYRLLPKYKPLPNVLCFFVEHFSLPQIKAKATL